MEITEQIFNRIEEILSVHNIAHNVANIEQHGHFYRVEYNFPRGGRGKISLEILKRNETLWGHFFELLQVAGTNTSTPQSSSVGDVRNLWFPLS